MSNKNRKLAFQPSMASGVFTRWLRFREDKWFHYENYLGGGFKYFLFLPLPGEMIQFDEHIF